MDTIPLYPGCKVHEALSANVGVLVSVAGVAGTVIYPDNTISILNLENLRLA